MNLFSWASEIDCHDSREYSQMEPLIDSYGAFSWDDYCTSGLLDNTRASYTFNKSSDGQDCYINNNCVSPSEGSNAEDDGQPQPEGLKSARLSLGTTVRDPAVNRIQRRRTQNRNSQRIYRQRRIEERQRFEERATAAEEESDKTKRQLEELHAAIDSLKEHIRRLEVDNFALRTATHAMPWRKD